MNYQMDVCDLKGCGKECRNSLHTTDWVTFNGRVWAFGQSNSEEKDLSFCSWDHFGQYVKAGMMRSK